VARWASLGDMSFRFSYSQDTQGRESYSVYFESLYNTESKATLKSVGQTRPDLPQLFDRAGVV